MYSIIGILIVAFGFFAPYLSKGMVSATLFFWIGFLLFFSPGSKKSSPGDWMQWAKVALVVNIVGGIISIIYSQCLLNTYLAKNFIIAKVFLTIIWLTTPITQIVALIYPVTGSSQTQSQLFVPLWQRSFLFDHSCLKHQRSVLLQINALILKDYQI